MMLHRRFRRVLASLLAIALFSLQAAPLQAAMMGTGELLQLEQGLVDRQQLNSLMARDDVREQLTRMGVDADQASERVAAMSDEEVRQLNGHLEELPAGGSILGAVLLIFVVFVITDMLGATDIFPFVDPIER